MDKEYNEFNNQHHLVFFLHSVQIHLEITGCILWTCLHSIMCFANNCMLYRSGNRYFKNWINMMTISCKSRRKFRLTDRLTLVIENVSR